MHRLHDGRPGGDDERKARGYPVLQGSRSEKPVVILPQKKSSLNFVPDVLTVLVVFGLAGEGSNEPCQAVGVARYDARGSADCMSGVRAGLGIKVSCSSAVPIAAPMARGE